MIDCENCPLSWEHTDHEGECYDCGCNFYDDLYGNKFICRLPNFIKRMIENYKNRESED